MKKRLFTVLMIVLLIGVVGCDPVEPQVQSEQSEYVLERDDLIMVNFSIVESGIIISGIYVFFFEGHSTMLAFPEDIQIKFDSSLNKPIVRAKSFKVLKGTFNDRMTMKGVEAFFKDKEQMQEYWLLK